MVQPALFTTSAPVAAKPRTSATGAARPVPTTPAVACDPGRLCTWRCWDSTIYTWLEYPCYEVPLAKHSFTPSVPCGTCGGRQFRTHYSIPTDAAGRPWPTSLAHWVCVACHQPLPEMRLAWWTVPESNATEKAA